MNGGPVESSSRMMKAVRFHGQRDIRLDEVPIPVCGKGQVKVGINRTRGLLNATDALVRSGLLLLEYAVQVPGSWSTERLPTLTRRLRSS